MVRTEAQSIQYNNNRKKVNYNKSKDTLKLAITNNSVLKGVNIDDLNESTIKSTIQLLNKITALNKCKTKLINEGIQIDNVIDEPHSHELIAVVDDEQHSHELIAMGGLTMDEIKKINADNPIHIEYFEDVKDMNLSNLDLDENTENDINQYKTKLNILWKNDIEYSLSVLYHDGDDDREFNDLVAIFIKRTSDLISNENAAVAHWARKNPVLVKLIISDIIKGIRDQMNA